MIKNLKKKVKKTTLLVGIISLSILCKAETVILEKESLYNSIKLVEDGRYISLYCGNGHQSMMDKERPDRLVFNYTKTMMTSLAHKNTIPKDILLIGGGGASIPKFIQKYFPETRVDVVEIDPEVNKIAQTYFKFKPSSNIRLFAQDGRVFIKKTTKKYDVIMLDAFKGGYIPFHLLTQEFLQESKKKLKPSGIIISNTFTGSKIKNRENATYFSVFKNLYEMETGGNRVIIADDRPINKQDFIKRASKLDEKYKFVGMNLKNIISSQFTPASKLNIESPLTDDHAPAELLAE